MRVRLGDPALGERELAAVAEVLETGMLTMGPKVAEFEELVARACETSRAVAVSSGTAALHLAVLALGIGPGDEVIVPAYTFPATANVVALSGARPVLVDVDASTLNLDPAGIEAGPRTRAILAVHLFGRPADWAALPDGVTVIEDAAGALGASWQGRPCGSLGALGCLSFHPRKIVTTGEGGAVTTNDEGLDASLRRLRNHGWRTLGEMPAPGFNYRLSDVLCAVGIPQLERLAELHAARARIAAGYTERLRDVVETPSAAEGDVHGWQAYVVLTDRRDEALAALRAEGIEAQIGTFALHRLGAYADQGPFPGAEAAFRRALALPFHTRITESDQDRVAEVLTRL
jgi:dTDP-4-amino-4,6-dideoxygalactose transaminase